MTDDENPIAVLSAPCADGLLPHLAPLSDQETAHEHRERTGGLMNGGSKWDVVSRDRQSLRHVLIAEPADD